MNSTRQTISNFLFDHGIPFEAFEHEPISTCEEGLRIAQRTGATCCKNLLLKNKKRFFLFMIKGESRFNAKEASKFLGCGHLSFASSEDLKTLMHTFAGAVSPLGLIFDTDNIIEVILAEDVTEAKDIDCHPCSNDESWKISVTELLGKFFPALNKQPIIWARSPAED